MVAPYSAGHGAHQTGRALVGWAKWLLGWGDPAPSTRSGQSRRTSGRTAPCRPARILNLRDKGFQGYTLRVDGLVENPVGLSFDQLKAMPKQEQITQHYCIQGWSAVAKWGGVPMRDILALV